MKNNNPPCPKCNSKSHKFREKDGFQAYSCTDKKCSNKFVDMPESEMPICQCINNCGLKVKLPWNKLIYGHKPKKSGPQPMPAPIKKEPEENVSWKESKVNDMEFMNTKKTISEKDDEIEKLTQKLRFAPITNLIYAKLDTFTLKRKESELKLREEIFEQKEVFLKQKEIDLTFMRDSAKLEIASYKKDFDNVLGELPVLREKANKYDAMIETVAQKREDVTILQNENTKLHEDVLRANKEKHALNNLLIEKGIKVRPHERMKAEGISKPKVQKLASIYSKDSELNKIFMLLMEDWFTIEEVAINAETDRTEEFLTTWEQQKNELELGGENLTLIKQKFDATGAIKYRILPKEQVEAVSGLDGESEKEEV